MIIKRSIILILLLCSGLLICSGIPEKPNPFRYVSDLANMFDDREVILLENRIRVFDQNTSNQIVIVTVPSLEGDSPYSYATEIGNVWGVGWGELNQHIINFIFVPFAIMQ